mgnify:CR=1 FL=1
MTTQLGVLFEVGGDPDLPAQPVRLVAKCVDLGLQVVLPLSEHRDVAR